MCNSVPNAGATASLARATFILHNPNLNVTLATSFLLSQISYIMWECVSGSPLSHNNGYPNSFCMIWRIYKPSRWEFGLNRRSVWEGFEDRMERGENVSQWNQETELLEILTIFYWRRESPDSGYRLNHLKSLQTIFSQQSKTDGWRWPPKLVGVQRNLTQDMKHPESTSGWT